LNGDWAGRADTARLAGNGSGLCDSSQHRKSEEFETHGEYAVGSVVDGVVVEESVLVVVLESD